MGTITVRTDRVVSDLEAQFSALYCKDDFEYKLFLLRDKIGYSDFPLQLQELYMMFDACGISYKRRSNSRSSKASDERLLREYQQMVEASEDIPDHDELQYQMLRMLYDRHEEYPTPTVYMQRLVDRLCDPADCWGEDPLRLRILKQFIKYGDYLEAEGYASRATIKKYVKAITGLKSVTEADILQSLDDGIFDQLQQSKDKIKPKSPLGLIKMADDLAAGNFRGQGGTRKSLYLFAMVYGMTYDPKGEERQDTDIARNLFLDYYNNNLMRYISASFRDNRVEYERDPSGQGINYKSYAEAVYLYFIHREDLSPQDKVRGAAGMIEALENAQFGQGLSGQEIQDALQQNGISAESSAGVQGAGGRESTGEQCEAESSAACEQSLTQRYKELLSEERLQLPEEAFKAFLQENYNADVYAGSVEIKAGKRKGETMDLRKGAFQLEVEQNSAYAQYEAILTEFIQLLDPTLPDEYDYAALSIEEQAAARQQYFGSGSSLDDEDAVDGGYGYDCCADLWLSGIQDTAEGFAEQMGGQDPARMEEFRQLLLGINGFVADFDRVGGVKISKAMNIASADKVTRSAILIAYYHYQNARIEILGAVDKMSYKEVLQQFEAELNPCLEDAFYQRVSAKNILDILLISSTYIHQLEDED